MTKEQRLKICSLLNISIATLWRWEKNPAMVKQVYKDKLKDMRDIPEFLK